MTTHEQKALELAAQFERSAAAIKQLDAIIETTTHKADRYLEAAAELRRLASVEAEIAAIKALEPVAWISTDCIGERYFVFSKPLDDDPLTPLYAIPQTPKEST